MSWRVDNWENSYSDDKVVGFDLSRRWATMKDGSSIDESIRRSLRDTFEAGADTLLKTLTDKLYLIRSKEILVSFRDEENKPVEYLRMFSNIGFRGWVVFIPDEETREEDIRDEED